jgi:hypothetical protein
MTKTQLIAARAAAGAAYVAAAQAYISAYVSLASYDITCTNQSIGVPIVGSGFPMLPTVLQHSEFLRDLALAYNGRPQDSAMAAAVAIIPTISGA